MAINFLNDVSFNKNELIQPVLENQANDAAAGTPADGQLYYNTTDNEVLFGEGGAWVALAASSGSGTVTSISLTSDSGTTSAITTSGTFDIEGGTNVTTSATGTTVTINSTDQYVGTVTSVTLAAATGDKAGISLSGTNPITSSGTITLGVDIDAQTELATTAAGGDYVLLWDADADTNKKISVTNLVAAAPQGDITAITAGDGIAVTSGTGPVPTIAVDYTATGLIADATDGTGVTLVDADDFLFLDDGGGGVKYGNLSQLATYIGAGTYSWTLTADSGSNQTILSGNTVNLEGTGGQIETVVAATDKVTFAFPSGGFTAPDGSVATTQSNSDGSTKLATTAYVDSMVATIPAGLVFQGNWNASTNTPTLASGTGTPGYFYIVSVAGTTTLDGISDWAVGDWAVFTEQGGTDAWEKVDNTSTLSGSGVSGRVSYWSGTATLASTAGFTFDGADLVVPTDITATAGSVSAGTSVSATTSVTSGTTMSAGSTMTIGTIAEVGSDTDKFLMSDSGVVKYATGADVRSYIGAGTGSGTVTSITFTSDSGSTSAITTSGTIDIEGGTNVTTSATGSTVTINSTDQYTGTVTSVGVTDGYLIDTSGTNPITSSGTITFDVDASELTDMTGTILSSDEAFVLDVSETGKDQGKRKAWSEIISDLSIKTGSADNYQYWTLTGDSGSQQVDSTETVDIAGGTYITTAATATNTLTVNHDATSRSDTTSSASPGSGGTLDVVDSVTTNATGHITAINVETVTFPTSDNYSSWTLTADSGSNQTILSGNTVDVAGGTGVTTVVSATDTVTVNLTSGSTGSFSGPLTDSTTGIAKAEAGGYTTFTITTAGAGVFGVATASRQCVVEVMDGTTFATVYPEVSRSTDALIEIKFKGSISNDDYDVTIIHAGTNN